MREKVLPFPLIASIAGTRVALGMGIGLLLAGKFSNQNRKKTGWALVTGGALSTIPIAISVFKRWRGGEHLAA
jgi:hypothetical protein